MRFLIGKNETHFLCKFVSKLALYHSLSNTTLKFPSLSRNFWFLGPNTHKEILINGIRPFLKSESRFKILTQR